MKNKLFAVFTLYGKKLICILLSLIISPMLLSAGVSAQKNNTSKELEALIDGIINYKITEASGSSVQNFIDNNLTSVAGTGSAEWYVVSLCQYKNSYDYSAYISSLNKYVSSAKNLKATDLQRIAIAFAVTGTNPDFIKTTIENSIGKLGIASYVYGLILLDSGAYSSAFISRNDIIEKILSLTLPDGGWALTGRTSDIDITAMTIQALAPYYKFNDVRKAVDNALTMLSQRQLENGDYSSWGTRCSESTAQVIATLSSLNIDCRTDSRFIKNGNTLIDGLLLYKLSDGSFSHTPGGSYNNTASVQAMYSLISVWRQQKGLSSLYKFTDKIIEREVNNTEQSNTVSQSLNSSSAQSLLSYDSSAESSAGVSKEAEYEASETEQITGEQSFLPDLVDTESTVSIENYENGNKSTDYKFWAFAAISTAALITAGWFLITKKLNKKNILLLMVITAVAFCAVGFSTIQSVDEYYLIHTDDIKPDSKTVSISIRCDTVTGKSTAEYIPKNGTVLDNTQYVLRDGDTVFDVLLRAVKHNKIQMEYEGVAGTTYIKGINYIYEYDFGETSGWMYKVNGKFENTGCSDCALSGGDVIEFLYTCDFGKDVGEQ